ncbi:MAG: hypothetical protein N3C59_03375 [Azovibrio sp.]|nr:hypothetical protein [Azovibrio sp.]
MSDQDAAPSPQFHIAEAIRAKRERRSLEAIQAELDALEAALLADISNFDLEAAARQVVAAEQQRRAGLAAATELAFPDIVAEGASPRLVGRGDAPGMTPPAAVSADAAAPGLGLLDQLRQQAEACQHRQNAEHHHLSMREARLDQALRQVFGYLHELVQQLNIIKPAIPRRYLVPGATELEGLLWQQGFADYRSRPQSAGATLESVSFSYRLTGARGVVIERDGSVAESFRQALFDLNLNVRVEEFRNERRYLERARFIVEPEVKVNVRWEADLASGHLVIVARNLERLGTARYSLAPEAVSQALLDEFGRMVLGQAHQFPRLLSR